jgi:Zn-dependent protease with chaperone function
MLPISLLGGGSFSGPALTLLAALAPALFAWWSGGQLLQKRDDPALPELLAGRRRANVRAIAIAVVVMIMLGGASAGWGIPLLIAAMIAAAYPLRTRLLGETWGFAAYLWHTARSIAAGFGFWIALAYAPIVVRLVMTQVGAERRWLAVALAAVLAALLIAWEAWYPRIWLWAHAGEPLVSAALTPRFDEIVRRAGTVTPAVYRVGPRGSRFVNAVALPSVGRPSIAMGTALLELLDADEATAIFAHEVAHFDHFTPRRVRLGQLLNRGLIVIGVSLPLVMPMATLEWAQWMSWLWPVVVLAALLRRAAKSQQHETESDLRAAELSGDSEALVRGLVKLHLHARIPRRYAVDMERAASHPSLVRRIQAIRAGSVPAGSAPADGALGGEELGTPTVIRSPRAGSWVVLDQARSYWLDGVPVETPTDLATLRDAASSYRAVSYRDLTVLRVPAVGIARAIAARTRGGDAWTVPLAADDVARVQRTLDVVDLKLGKAGPEPARGAAMLVVTLILAVTVLSGQAGIVLIPIIVALWKPGPAALAALGAMSIVRAVLGMLEGSSWLDETLVRLGLAALAVLGVAAIYFATRLVRAGRGKEYRRVTIGVLLGVAALVGVGVAWQVVMLPVTAIQGAPIFGTLGTVLAGVAAAALTMQTRRSRQAGYAGLVAAAVIATASVDRSAFSLRNALAETTARATPVSETDLGGPAQRLRVSPDGTHFLALRESRARRTTPRLMATLLAGRVGGEVRELAATSGEFVDNERMLMLDVLDRGVELRLERVDGAGPPAWVDTIADLDLFDPRLRLDRDTGTWSVVGEDGTTDRTAVVMGTIGEKGSVRRTVIPDSIAMTGEPIVFGATSAVVVPTYRNTLRGSPLALWSVLGGIGGGIQMDLWRVRGDTVRRVATLPGAVQCGEPLGGAAVCTAQRRSRTSLYTVSADGEATEVARLPLQDLGVVALGPGRHAASMTFKREIVTIDLAARRLTRLPLPPNSDFASEVRAGPGWVVTLGYTANRKSTVRLYHVMGTRE